MLKDLTDAMKALILFADSINGEKLHDYQKARDDFEHVFDIQLLRDFLNAVLVNDEKLIRLRLKTLIHLLWSMHPVIHLGKVKELAPVAWQDISHTMAWVEYAMEQEAR